MGNQPPTISPEIQEKLAAARIAHLATLDADLRPHVVPICFIWDGSLFYSAIDQKPKRVAPTELARVKNIRRAPQVSLLVDYYDEDWTRLWYVLVHGEAGMVTDPAERTRAIQRLRAKYPQYDARMLADDSPVLRIVPARVTMWGRT
jgi:PPOX class probable F420-dependent enzyme